MFSEGLRISIWSNDPYNRLNWKIISNVDEMGNEMVPATTEMDKFSEPGTDVYFLPN